MDGERSFRGWIHTHELSRTIGLKHGGTYMLRRKLLLVLTSLLLFSTWTFAQRPVSPACLPSLNSKLICVVPQTYGPNGLVLPNPNHNAHFVSSFQENFVPLTVSLGSELTLLSL